MGKLIDDFERLVKKVDETIKRMRQSRMLERTIDFVDTYGALQLQAPDYLDIVRRRN